MENLNIRIEEQAVEVKLVPCVITGQFDKCIVLKLGEITIPGEETPAEVCGQFSRDGLLKLLADLEAAPSPIELPTSEAIRLNNPYQWGVKYDDGTQVQQYMIDGTEVHFGTVELPRVTEFWLLPRDGFVITSLPIYILSREKGFYRCVDGTWVPLDLPFPYNEPFEWHYYRRNTLHFGSYAGATDQLPPHCVQVLGWRIGETILEIGVEEDGSWQVFRKQPFDDARFQPANKTVTSDLPVRILELAGVG